MLRKQLWIWPVLAVVLLATIGYIVNQSIRRTMEAMLHSELVTLVEIERSMVDKWCRVQAASAVAMANDSQIRRAVLDLLAATAAAADAEQDAAE
ncbi:MAG: hypothetical protein JNG90_18395, partial [Planctomycetaceae bacterium]|nr:hypothetical protein [Planctomycetaceae bacterium]